VKQLSQDEAVAIHDSGAWRDWTMQQRAAFQMVQNRLCMPFDAFHEAITATLGRPVYTHEFGLNRAGLQRELAGLADAPSLDEIMALIPADKLIAVGVSHG